MDIDYQAVEVTKLSLLLRCLEGETAESLRAFMTLFRERALPDLGRNIQCGNSLIGTDIMITDAWRQMSEEERQRINPFDYERAFPQVFKQGGFDAVIGNPPYDVLEKERNAASWPHAVLMDYVRENEDYAHGLGGKLNLFRFFVVRAQRLTRSGGMYGMIVPLSLLADISTASTRRSFFESFDNIVADCFPQKDIPSRRVFLDAKLSTVVVTAMRAREKRLSGRLRVRVYPWNRFEDQHKECEIEMADLALLDPENVPVPLVNEDEWLLLRKLHSRTNCVRLGTITYFRVTRGEINQTVYRDFITRQRRHARLLKGVEVRRYGFNSELQQGHREWFDEGSFLAENNERPVIRERRIATQRITGVDERLRIVAAIVDPPCYFADSTNSIAAAPQALLTLEYLLALLNCKLMQWRFKRTSTNNNVGTNELECLPIFVAGEDASFNREAQTRLEHLVNSMMSDVQREEGAKHPQEKEQLRRRIEATDRQIDQLVYQLYGLSDAEIKIVEESTK